MDFSIDRVRDNVAKADTADLLDRVTAYAAGLEPEAVSVILEELRSRGVTPEAIVEHERSRPPAMMDPAGVAVKCSECPKPAVTREFGWFRVFGRKVPVVPGWFPKCEEHRKPDPTQVSQS